MMQPSTIASWYFSKLSGLAGLYADFVLKGGTSIPTAFSLRKDPKEPHQRFIHSCLTRAGLLRHQHVECLLTQEFAAGLVQEYGPFSVVVANLLRRLQLF